MELLLVSFRFIFSSHSFATFLPIEETYHRRDISIDDPSVDRQRCPGRINRVETFEPSEQCVRSIIEARRSMLIDYKKRNIVGFRSIATRNRRFRKSSYVRFLKPVSGNDDSCVFLRACNSHTLRHAPATFVAFFAPSAFSVSRTSASISVLSLLPLLPLRLFPPFLLVKSETLGGP